MLGFAADSTSESHLLITPRAILLKVNIVMRSFQRNLKLLCIGVFLLGWSAVAYAFSSGPPAGRTGAPGELNCTNCHGGSANSGGGRLSITGLPASYTPGTKYSVTVTVAQNGRQRWGFQITSLTDDGSFAGSFTLTSPSQTQQTSTSVSGKQRTYVQHTSAGTQRGTPNQASFTFDWTAPASNVGAITFYSSGNAANGDGTSSGDSIYTTNVKVNAPAAAQPPTVTTLNPNRGTTVGGTSVTISGTNFANGISATFDGLAAQTTFVDNKTIRVTTPAHAAGAVDVVVKNSDGLSGTLRGGFTYEAPQLAPTVTGITPTFGPTAGGTDVTLTGTNFVQGLSVSFGSRELTPVSVSATEIKVRTQPNSAGSVDVIVRNPDGQQGVLANAFTFEGENPGTTVEVIAPNGNEVLSAGGLPFNITWDVVTDSTAVQSIELSVDGGTTYGTQVATGLASSAMSFAFAVPAGTTSEQARIRVSVQQGDTIVSDESDANFRILAAPVISSITPTSATANSTVKKLVINGSGFQTGAVVQIDGVTTTAKTKVKTTSVQVKKLPAGAAGTKKVRVRNPDGTISAEVTLTVQ
jgi:hypothetical protein